VLAASACYLSLLAAYAANTFVWAITQVNEEGQFRPPVTENLVVIATTIRTKDGCPFPPKSPIPMGGSGPHLTYDSLGQSEPTSPQPKQHHRRFSRFCTDYCSVSLYFTMGRPFLLKLAPSHGGSGSPSDTWFSGTTRVLNPNGMLIGKAIFAGLINVRDRQTTLLGR